MKGLGRFLFKLRSYTPLPVVLAYFIVADVEILSLVLGIFLILLGEFIRLYSVAFIGSISRTRGDATGNLVITGPYAAVRNPLYVGNFFIFMGFVTTSGNLILIAASLALFVFQYTFIVIYEEDTLLEKFGNEYIKYKKSVHPLIPNLIKVFDKNNYSAVDITKGFRSERWTLIAVLFFIGIPTFLFLYPQITEGLRDLLAKVFTF
ncbi:isoprenylcysteine carboxylmethyltransferase family protein [bacterium]|nr:isoprenylcysteine carboxylmethyltransferase family protein [bacterium]